MGVGTAIYRALFGIKGKDGSAIASASNPVPVEQQGTVAVSGPLTDAELRADEVPTTDAYTAGQVLADQSGADGVLTFTFANQMDLIWVRSDGGDSRADPFGGTPTSSLGIKCEDGIPNPLTIQATVVKVYAPAGATVNVWGYRYG